MNSTPTDKITIVPFEDMYQQAFKDLNQWWIEKYFKMEELDYIALDNPKSYILERGGYIVVALLADKPIGVCALIKTHKTKFNYELAKMGVSPEFHGKGIGYLLGKAIITKAKELGAKNVFLETHSSLRPAIYLYKKLGFQKINGIESPYERSDYQMELKL